jgi:hypothetical protein
MPQAGLLKTTSSCCASDGTAARLEKMIPMSIGRGA